MNHNLSMEAAVTILVVTSLLFLIAILFGVFFVTRLENKLLLLGLSTAVAAILYGSVLGGEGFLVHAAAGRPPEGTTLVGRSLPGSLMKIAFVLVLGGIAAGLWSYWGRVSAPTPRENAFPPNREGITDVK